MITKNEFLKQCSILNTLFDGYFLQVGESFHNDTPINKYIEVGEKIEIIRPNQIYTNYNPRLKAKVLTNI